MSHLSATVSSMPTSQSPHEASDHASGNARPKSAACPKVLWQRCPGCQQTIFRKQAERAWASAPSATITGTSRPRSASSRCSTKARSKSGTPIWSRPIRSSFADKMPYRERLNAEQARTGLRDAAIVGTGMIRARRVAFGVTDSAFIMGSMGSVVGEKLTRLIERATEQNACR